jgi:mycothiol synthase
MDLPPAYQFRAPTPDDLDGVAGAIVDDLHDGRESVLDADFLRDEWSRVGFDLATDAWVVIRRGDAIVGCEQAMREEPTVVEPGGSCTRAPGRGVGSWLLDRIQQRASELLAGIGI